MARRWLELARDKGLTTGISQENGRARGEYHLSGVTEADFPAVQDLRNAINELLGGVDNLQPATSNSATTGGRIQRRLPKCHPYLELPLAGINEITGQANQTESNPIVPVAYGIGGQSTIQPQFTHYSNYRFSVEYAKRSYFLKANEFISTGADKYYAPGETSTGGTQYHYAKEWERFTWRTFAPVDNNVTTEFGQMKFSANGAAIDGKQFVGTPYVDLQNWAVEVTWYQVPLRYFFDYTINGVTYKSYLKRFKNCVNQKQWWNYAPGTLLYLGATPEPYIPAIPQQIRGFGGLPIATSESLLCNVKLKFLETSRAVGTAPNPADTQFNDLNIVAAGHNLQPNYADRKFYYSHTEDPATPADQTKWKPTFNSFPFELFFTDPLLIQASPI